VELAVWAAGRITKIACLSDTHGQLPDVPDCDLLLLAGDYCPEHRGHQYFWFRDEFGPWLRSLSERMKVIGVAGNHDWLFQDSPDGIPPLAWTYLQDRGTEFHGLKIYGSPWQLPFFDWAFNAEESDLKRKWDMIPDDTDILLLHGPPHEFGDFTGCAYVGSPSLTRRIEQVQPKLVVCGHIHSAHGRYQIGETVVINAAHVDERYEPKYPVEMVTLTISPAAS
jgi:Icc-related predicted phosphoesterase